MSAALVNVRNWFKDDDGPLGAFYEGLFDDDDDGWLEAGESRTPGVAGLSTAALQGPTGYDGIYRTWNLDLDGDLVPDAPWFPGSARGYPILAVLDYNAGGYQLTRAPTLSAATSAGQAQVALSWTALVTRNFWLDGPDITYSLIRDDGAAFKVLLEETGDLRYTDASVTAGTTYTYQVAAVVQGGEATRSAALQVVAGAGNQPPVAVGALADRTLRAGGGAVRVNVAGAFADPENDALTYGASSSATGVATVVTSGAQVTITPAGTGAATITVTATDAAGSNTSAGQRFRATVWPATAVDYDADDDGLIEIATPAQLDAVRHDLDGDGTPASGGATSYRAAFADAGDGLGCGGVDGCTGYELAADLDLDTNGSGGPDAGDDYWNGGRGWDPIGSDADPFAAILDGNGRTIANLFIAAAGGGGVANAGLFGVTGPTSVIRGVGLAGVAVRARGDYVGSLIGVNNGIVTASHATGRVEGDDFVGGLVGLNGGAVATSYATGRVEGDLGIGGLAGVTSGAVAASYATGRVAGRSEIGGLVGFVFGGTVNASYSTGPATGAGNVGGLVGRFERGDVTASYATGLVTGDTNTGGLVGNFSNDDITNSYWNLATQGLIFGKGSDDSNNNGALDAGETNTLAAGQTDAELRAPTGYTGIYANWNVNVDGRSGQDGPWDFGADHNYPTLKAPTGFSFGAQQGPGPVVDFQLGVVWCHSSDPDRDSYYCEVDGSWETPTATGEGTLTNVYQVRYSGDGRATWTDWVDVAGRPLQAGPGIHYAVFVDAFLPKVFGAWRYALQVRAVSSGSAHNYGKADPGYYWGDPSRFVDIPRVDHDYDNDGLIEIWNSAQYKARGLDLNNDGRPDAPLVDADGDGVPEDAANLQWRRAFINAADNMGCPASGCIGYELPPYSALTWFPVTKVIPLAARTTTPTTTASSR